MKQFHVLPLLGVLLLAACSAPPVAKTSIEAPPIAAPLDTILAEADAAGRAGQVDKARALLHKAAAAYPADKQAWLSLAQGSFDRGEYGEAISEAQQVLQRDAENKVAHSIVAVSGLRAASSALAELSMRNNLAGNVRNEAQELAKLLRTSLGEAELVPANAGARTKPGPVTTLRSKPGLGNKNASDPFGALK
ncbi:tetratricopeptide repeat protein [Massilia sp. TS11]|uniref:tetratricopeptide repeat protein n=1 Tax=Massilia sp. TS11 TaxID=2908003 RepID=UPI001EDB0093|nr:hypothetical protein [Massilia sp. TS11]MCG2584203.1 hypothetical protein [Massilia sp. TS11]